MTGVSNMSKIVYTDEQKACFETEGRNLQIIASAGSGKTETMSRRCATLIKNGLSPSNIIAFTFTNKAADSLRSRIEMHISEMLGVRFLPKLSQMFIGTIHSYCYQLLQKYEPKYATFDIADEHKVAAVLSKEYENVGLGKLDIKKHWDTISTFLDNLNVVENELIPIEKITNRRFVECIKNFQEILFDYRLLTFGQLISQTLKMLERKEIYDEIVSQIRHIIVDEYQDINPAQEKLIELLSSRDASLTVVGDDLQSIYQWRGSTVENIITFKKRYPNVDVKPLSTNFRSRPGIIKLAEEFSKSIHPRLRKEMKPFKTEGDVEYYIWSSESPQTEAITVANTILALSRNGFSYGDIAILLRSTRTSAQPFIEAFQSMGIPFHCSGRTGLFLQPEAQLFAMTFAWFINEGWRPNPFDEKVFSVDLNFLLDEYTRSFDLKERDRHRLKTFLKEWKADTSVGPPRSLVRDFYLFLKELGFREWNLNDSTTMNLMGTIARFAQLLADFEYVAFRRSHTFGRKATKNFYFRLFNYLQYYALSAYEGYPGEMDYQPNAVTISTVHQAKGLEWPIVFIPCLASSRFPSSRIGTKKTWLINKELFPPKTRERYEGTETDERRLFFVAITRAKETLYLSTFKRIKNSVKPSPFILECNNKTSPSNVSELPISTASPKEDNEKQDRFRLSLSQVSLLSECPLAFRLRDSLGFPPPLAIALGYGNAIHHILRRLAEYTMKNRKIPDSSYLEKISEEEFYLPYATKTAFSRMKAKSARIIRKYMSKFGEDFLKICRVEYPLELFLPTCTIIGRSDALLKDKHSEFIILDFKTSIGEETLEKYVLQQSVYSTAATDAGLNIVKYYIDDIESQERFAAPVNQNLIDETRKEMNSLAKLILENRFEPKPGSHCEGCDVKYLCKYG
jgi:DNA helicase-2/ATP-dependent DNA helicase PcrA